MTVRPETNVRLTDILGDKVLERLGNAGNELLADLLDKFHSALGMPFEVTPADPGDKTLNIAGAIYTLPDGKRTAPMRNGAIPQISSTIVNFGTGTISSGTNPTFVNPSIAVNNYVKSLVQYNYDLNAFDVTFGSENIALSGCGNPLVKINFDPICQIEMHSLSGGVGQFDPIFKNNLIVIVDSMDFEQEPAEEIQTTITAQSTFNLATIIIPKQRKRLMIFVNGVYQIFGTHYNVTGDTQVTFTSAIPSNAEVLFRVV
jgi:hypothetical protein